MRPKAMISSRLILPACLVLVALVAAPVVAAPSATLSLHPYPGPVDVAPGGTASFGVWLDAFNPDTAFPPVITSFILEVDATDPALNFTDFDFFNFIYWAQ